ncbi:MAG: DUF262 domain-containing protein [Rhodocyclaceae bacterium]
MTKKQELNKDAADLQLKERNREINFDLKDYTIELLVEKFKRDEFWIPPYQREFVWKSKNKNYFIESVLLGLPIPFMFMAENDDGRLEIVDGAQRIQTLEEFLASDLTLEGLERLDKLNGFSFDDLPDGQKRRFRNRALRIIVLDERTESQVRHEIFNRINTTGQRVRPSEVRIGAFPGAFMEFIEECSNLSLFKSLCPISEKMAERQEGQELVLRFFCYLDRYQLFKHDVEKFLTAYVVEHKDVFDIEQGRQEFLAMLRFVKKHFPLGFAKTKGASTTPRVRFEAISVGTALALRADPNCTPKDMSWLESSEFAGHTTTHASNSGPRLRGRVEYVREALLRS